MSKPELVHAGNRTFVDRRLKMHRARIAQLEKFIDTHPEYTDHHIRINVVNAWNRELYQPMGDSDSDNRVRREP